MSVTKRSRTLCNVAIALSMVTLLGETACAPTGMQPSQDREQSATSNEFASCVPLNQSEEHSSDESKPSADGQDESTEENGCPSAQTSESSTSWPSSNEAAASSQEKEPIWIVDIAGRTETVHHEATGYWTGGGYYTMCTLCQQEITGSPMAHMDSEHPAAASGSWTDVARPAVWVETSPAWDEQVYVPEQGHWEYR